MTLGSPLWETSDHEDLNATYDLIAQAFVRLVNWSGSIDDVSA